MISSDFQAKKLQVAIAGRLLSSFITPSSSPCQCVSSCHKFQQSSSCGPALNRAPHILLNSEFKIPTVGSRGLLYVVDPLPHSFYSSQVQGLRLHPTPLAQHFQALCKCAGDGAVGGGGSIMRSQGTPCPFGLFISKALKWENPGLE